MKITPELVDRIAFLSRLKLPQAEKEGVVGELEQILSYMDTLNQLDTQGVEPMSHIIALKNVFREDTVEPSQAREELLKNAPKSDGETFLVPKAVE
ncbi:MAG: Asp-tRNA(Asn)/Glu-tRNA(Gln) amidotransferase subunit GatC [Lawsonibacter sp.]|jgi:aspartyl-tRNA(Asn)/glutamyl-tRNA(Gln) amidotransferase subunit C